MFKQHVRSWLFEEAWSNGQGICELKFCWDSLHFQFSISNSFSNIEVSDANVLREVMELGVLSQLDSSLVVKVIIDSISLW